MVRRLCPRCKKPHEATESERKMLGLQGDEPMTIYEPQGCDLCADTGYYGRIGVYEIMEITPELRHIITSRGSTADILKSALDNDMHTLQGSAIELVLEGTTSISEMVKISLED